jgi:hypothetical protein
MSSSCAALVSGYQIVMKEISQSGGANQVVV